MGTKEDTIVTVCHTCNELKPCAFSEVVDWEAYEETGDSWHYCDDCKETVLRDRRIMWVGDWVSSGGDVGELAMIRKEIRKLTTEHLAGKRDRLLIQAISSPSANVTTAEINSLLEYLTDEQTQNWIMAHLVTEELRERGMEYANMGENRQLKEEQDGETKSIFLEEKGIDDI